MPDAGYSYYERGIMKAIDILLQARPDDLIHRSADYAAAALIAEHKSVRIAVREYTIKRLLKLHNKVKHKGFYPVMNTDALKYAGSLVCDGVSRNLKERVAKEYVEMGWYGRIEDYVLRYCNRGLKKDEIFTLVDCYVKNTASRGDYIEKELCTLAEKYLTREDARIVYGRIKEFVDEWNSHPLD